MTNFQEVNERIASQEHLLVEQTGRKPLFTSQWLQILEENGWNLYELIEGIRETVWGNEKEYIIVENVESEGIEVLLEYIIANVLLPIHPKRKGDLRFIKRTDSIVTVH